MSDNDLQAKDALAETSADAGQSEQASDDKAQAGSEKQASKKVNLQEYPEFREFQSKADARAQQLEREVQATKQREAEYKQRLEQLEDAAYGKDDYSKLQLVATRAAREAEAAKRELEQYKARESEQSAKRQALQEIADEFEVSIDTLTEATDYKHATKLARAARDKLIAARLHERESTREANKPDLGGGGRSTPSTRWEQEYADAMKRKDSIAVARLLRTKGK